jgi:hypothetical protein
MDFEAISKKIAALREVMEEQAREMDALEKSLAIKHLWPEAFEGDSAPSVHVDPDNRQRYATHIEIRKEGFESKRFHINEVPEVLLPSPVRRMMEEKRRKQAMYQSRRSSKQ